MYIQHKNKNKNNKRTKVITITFQCNLWQVTCWRFRLFFNFRVYSYIHKLFNSPHHQFLYSNTIISSRLLQLFHQLFLAFLDFRNIHFIFNTATCGISVVTNRLLHLCRPVWEQTSSCFFQLLVRITFHQDSTSSN
jgi:hypothetical protein